MMVLNQTKNRINMCRNQISLRIDLARHVDRMLRYLLSIETFVQSLISLEL